MAHRKLLFLAIGLLAITGGLAVYAQAPSPRPSPPALTEGVWQPITDSFGFVALRVKPPREVSSPVPGTSQQAPGIVSLGEAEGYFLIHLPAGWCRVEAGNPAHVIPAF